MITKTIIIQANRTLMNLSSRIAFRYLISKKKASFINLISWLALLGIAFGTTALVIVLSVFNGLEDLNRSLFNTFDSDLIILPKEGKKFNPKLINIAEFGKLLEIKSYSKIIQENALVKYGDQQSVAIIKGVENSFLQNESFKKSIIDGTFKLKDEKSNLAIIGIGIQDNLSISIDNFYTPIEFWYPTKSANLNLATENSFNKLMAYPSGVFSIEQSYDNYVIVPIELTMALFDRKTEISAFEINLKNGVDIEKIRPKIATSISKNLKILSRDEQHVGLLRAIKIEKLFVFLSLIFIIGIAALNIFFSLSMLVIEKKEDIKTLKALGASKRLIGNIFKIEGLFIALIGTGFGLILGFVLCALQLKYGLLKMGMVSALVDAYPIRIEFGDFFFTGLAIFLLSLLISQFPSKKAENIS
ncbi:MAG: FtsX-like permease family protein [Bacteroidota bacterium]